MKYGLDRTQAPQFGEIDCSGPKSCLLHILGESGHGPCVFVIKGNRSYTINTILIIYYWSPTISTGFLTDNTPYLFNCYKMVKVLLTGASGFVATHILKILLDKDYHAVATVRSQEKALWIDKIFSEKKNFYTIENVPDIAADGAFDHVFKQHPDLKYVIHTASPFFRPSSDPENTILKPAIKGTTNILKAVKEHGPAVEHVVITSSFAAIMDPSLKGGIVGKPSLTYTEKTWSPVTYDQAAKNLDLTYVGSKTVAEQSFWKFIKEEGVKFSGTTINPSYVFGPILQEVKNADALNTSNAVLYKLMKSTPSDRIDNIIALAVDVRDVALAHVLAIEKKESAGQRWFLTSDYFTSYDALKVLAKDFPELNAAHVPTDYDEKATFADLAKFDNHLTSEQTGIQYYPIEKTLEDTFKSLILAEKNWDNVKFSGDQY